MQFYSKHENCPYIVYDKDSPQKLIDTWKRRYAGWEKVIALSAKHRNFLLILL